MADAQETIEALNKQFSDAFKRGDFDMIAAMYTNDAVMLPPGSAIIVGQGNIQSFWKQARRIQELKFDTVSIKLLGDDAVREIGTLHMRTRSGAKTALAGAQAREITSKYVFVWQKVGGQWKRETSIWNRIGPRPPLRRLELRRLRRAE